MIVSTFRYTESKESESSYGRGLCAFAVCVNSQRAEYFLLVCLGYYFLDISETLRAYVEPK